MKRSSSYKKRKRKTLNTTLNKRIKQEGGYTNEELFLYIDKPSAPAPAPAPAERRGVPAHYTRASLGNLNNLDIKRNPNRTNISLAQSTDYGYIRDDTEYVYRPKVHQTSNRLTLDFGDVNKGWYDKKRVVPGESYGTWIYDKKPGKTSNSPIIPYNYSFYSEFDYPKIITVARLDNTPTGLYVTDDQTIYVSDRRQVLEISVKYPCDVGVHTTYRDQTVKFSLNEGRGFTMDANSPNSLALFDLIKA